MRKVLLLLSLIICAEVKPSWQFFNSGVQTVVPSSATQQNAWFSYKTALLIGGAIAGGIALYKSYPKIKESIKGYYDRLFFGLKNAPLPSTKEVQKQNDEEVRSVSQTTDPNKKSKRLSLIESLRSSLKQFDQTKVCASKRVKRGMPQKNRDFIQAVSAYLLDDNSSEIASFQKKYKSDTDVVRDISAAQLLISQIKENKNIEQLLEQLRGIDLHARDCGSIDGITCQLLLQSKQQPLINLHKTHSTLLTTHTLSDKMAAEFSHVYSVNENNLGLTFCALLDQIEEPENTVVFWTDNTECGKYFKELILTENYCIAQDCEQEELENQSVAFTQNCQSLYDLLLARWNNKPKSKNRSCANSFRKELEAHHARLNNGQGSSGT